MTRNADLQKFVVYASLAVAVLMAYYLGLWGFEIKAHRPWRTQSPQQTSAYEQAVGVYPAAATALLTGFRGIAVDLLWMKADSYWHHGQWQRLLPLYHLITVIQPRFTLVWSDGGWHMAYNRREMARRNPQYSPEKRLQEARRWMDEAILFLQRGLAYNQDKPDLYFDLGWTYFDKFKDYAAAIGYLEKAVQKGPGIPRLKALAHAYEKVGRWSHALRTWETLDAQGDTVATKRIPELKKKIVQEGSR